jgi:transposase
MEPHPGNMQDAKAFKLLPDALQERLNALKIKPKNITLIFDKGNHSLEAFQKIDQMKIGFVASYRNSCVKNLLHIPESHFTTTILPSTGKEVRYFWTKSLIYGRRRLVYIVLDPAKQKKHQFRFEEFITRKITIINDFFNTRLNVKKWREPVAVTKKIRTIIGKQPYKSVIKFSVSGTPGQVSYTLSQDYEQLQYYREPLGKTVLFTNRNTWAPEDVIWGYREQYEIEQTFRHMKCPHYIALSPMYSYTDPSICGHLFLCFLAYLLLVLLRYKLSKLHINGSIDEILAALRTVHVVAYSIGKSQTVLRKMEEPKGFAKSICKALHLDHLV